MPISGKKLSPGTKGDEVNLLHTTLVQLGHFIPDDELNSSLFGKGTAEAVAAFQEKHGLKITGEVDPQTAEAINVATKQTAPPAGTINVKGVPVGKETLRKDITDLRNPVVDSRKTKPDGDEKKEPSIEKKEPATEKKEPPTHKKDLPIEKKDSEEQTKDRLTVSGTVFNSRHEPVAQMQVVVADVDLRGAAVAMTAEELQALKLSKGFEFLGTTFTDVKGRYEVSFTPRSYQNSELQRADVIAYAVENETIAGRSKLIIWKEDQEPDIKDLNITLTDSQKRGPSEYDRLITLLQPLLDSSKLQLHELNEAQAAFLAQETEEETNHITLLIDADKLHLDLANQSFKTELFYALGQQEIQPTWAAIATTSDDELRSAINRSIAENIISEQPGKLIEDFINALRRRATSAPLKKSSNPQVKALNGILKTVLKDDAARSSFLDVAATFSHTDPKKFWNEHLPAVGFKKEQIESLQLTNQLYILAAGHTPLMDQLKQKNITTPEKLIAVSSDEWQTIVNKAGVPANMPGKDDAEKQKLFVDAIQDQLNAAFPTVKIAQMVRANELRIADQQIKTHVQTFLETTAQFDFSTSRVSDFDETIRKVSNGKHEEVKTSLLTLQRVYQVSPSPDVMTTLLDNNLTSAYRIAAIPQLTFINNFAEKLGGKSMAWAVHQRAEHQVQRVQDLVVTFNEAVNSVTPAAAADDSERSRLRETLQRHIPNWEELFGSTNLCECQECRSVVSPAAYFVDLLQFLKNSTTASGNVLDDVLLRRRPDLAHLELTCENTNTIIPYIDLVNEILEYYLAHDGHLDENAAYNIEHETQAELRANPQHTHTEAYRKLSNQIFPFSLPYHQPLDVIRTYLNQIGTSRYELMGHLGHEPALPPAPPSFPNALAAEYLNLSPREFSILSAENFDGSTNRSADWQYFGYADDAAFRGNRHRVTELLERSGITYVELIELVKTRFLNPHQDTLDYVEHTFKRSSITPEELYEKMQRIRNRSLDVNSDRQLRAGLGRVSPAAFTARVNESFDDFRQVITLHEPGSTCNLATTTLRSIRSVYERLSSPDVPDAFFSKFHRFVRLWRKTGWTIAELDTLLTALQAPDITAEVISQLADAKKIQEQTRMSVPEMAVLWGSIDTYGPRSLYARLFLNKSVRQLSTAFEADQSGHYLSDPAVKIAQQTIPLLAAFRITSADFDSIVADLRMNPSAEPLSLNAVSRIYRYVVLANAFKLKVSELITLKTIFAINPFGHNFVELVQKVKESGFKAELLQYIFNIGTPNTRLQLNPDKTLQMARQVRDELLRIETDYPEASNTTVTDDLLRSKMQLIFQPQVVEHFFGLINNNLVYGTSTERNLEIHIPDALRAKASYKPATGRLEFKGVMTDAEKAALEALNVDENYRSAVGKLHQEPEKFFKENFTLLFREHAELNTAVAQIITRTASGLNAAEKLTLFYGFYLPFLKVQLKRSAVLLRLSALLGLDPLQTAALTASRLDELVENFQPQGLTADYFNATDFTGPSQKLTDETINFTWTSAPVRSITGASYAVRWEGYVCPDQTAEYIFIVDVRKGDDSFKLKIDDETLQKSEGDSRRLWQLSRSLRAREMYSIVLEYVHRSSGGGITLSWQTDTLPRIPIARTNLYPADEIGTIIESAAKYHRAASLINRFELSGLEIAYFIHNRADFGNVDFTNLTPQVWSRICDYTHLRSETGVQGEVWLSLFAAAHREPWEQLKNRLNEILDWSLSDLSALQKPLGLTATSFVNEEKLVPLLKTFELIRKTGLPAQKLIDRAVVTIDFDSLEQTALSVQQTVKAKYGESEWLEIAGHLSDKIRERQKQALISVLLVDPNLTRQRVRDADGLFEHFLIDVQMTACMDTSRIKQAISSIQLLVARCLLNLEERVSPANIDAVKWSWVKNYRVWEAARKIFLFPENWLEPEWRDDRSPFFKELESELQQNDVTAFSVETAIRNYLFKLNEVAHLNVCGVHEDSNTQTLHVFARTYQAPYQYFYRTRDRYKHWTPWEHVPLDIRGHEDLQTGGDRSGVHLVPAVWKGRLFLFWTELTEKTRPRPMPEVATREMANRPVTEMEPDRYWEVRLAWSEYRDAKWTPKKLSNRFAETLGLSSPSSHITRLEIETVTNELTFHVSGGIFVLSDAQSDIEVRGPAHTESSLNFYMGIRRISRPLRFLTDEYLEAPRDYKLIYSNMVQGGERNSPPEHVFFYSDRERSYFVEPVASRRALRNKNETTFVALAKAQSQMLNDGQANVLTTSSFLSASMAVDSSLINNLTSAATPLLSNGGLEAVGSLSKMSGTLTSSSFNLGSALGGKTQTRLGIDIRPNLPPLGIVFKNFFHPYASEYITQLNQRGVSGLLQIDTDAFYERGESLFKTTYRPNTDSGLVLTPLPSIDVDFDEFGAYSQYNYELFFHAPLYVATRLSRNGKFAEAMQWFHYIFDPTTSEPPNVSNPSARYWKVSPFREARAESLEQYLRKLQTGTDEEKRAITQKIEEWRDSPFKPHIIARGRPIAYMKNVIVKYIENLVAWGDDLFRRDTIESINEATQIYVIAAHVLGKRPEFIPRRGVTKAETYATIRSKLDAFSNALVQMENIFPFSSDVNVNSGATGNPASLLGVGRTLYFCIPNNERLLKLWDTVADRLFKIRYCMNIEGVERKLALFEPPIDPALLAQAGAAGISIGNILSDLNTTSPIYRFSFLLQKALEMVAEVKSLGSNLLSAIEKRDNEGIARLRAGHERHLLELVTSIRERQLLETRANREGLEKNRETAKMRLKHYLDLLGENDTVSEAIPQLPANVTPGSVLPSTTIAPIVPDVDVSLLDGGERAVRLIPRENEDLVQSNISKGFQITASAGEALAGILNLFPVIHGRITPFGVGAGASFGGPQLGAAVSALAKVAQMGGLICSLEAAQASKMASFVRRDQEWVMQANMAAREIIQIDKQIIAAQIREQIAQKELQNHRQQIANAREVEEFLRDKFSNAELYQWMKEQLVLVHKQAYQLAYDLAKQAEKAFRFDLGRADTSFIQYGYWNDTYEGLTAGEKLHLALKQMERSYLEDNRREYELTKHVSLALLDPKSLLELKQNGKCEFSLPEELFDLDHPGHYFRRIKSVGVSVPCVAGPQTTVSATLRLLRNSVRINTAMSASRVYPRNRQDGLLLDDDRFVEYNVPFRAIATSSAQADAGVFELNFRDERYLPFEGAGAISRWQLEMPNAVRQFDYNTITDVVIHLRYTAREGGGTLRHEVETTTPAEETLKSRFLRNGFARLLSLKHDLPQVFHQLTQPAPGAENRVIEFSIEAQHLPYFLAHDDLRIRSLTVFLQAKEPNNRVVKSGYEIRVNGLNVGILDARNFGRNMLTKFVTVDSEEEIARLKRRHTIQISTGELPTNLGDLLLLFEV